MLLKLRDLVKESAGSERFMELTSHFDTNYGISITGKLRHLLKDVVPDVSFKTICGVGGVSWIIPGEDENVPICSECLRIQEETQ